ncbi:MOSC domain-containing protein [Pilimelia terevasa]|uniref:MOSC domain-containing protein n=1 Tax=Pilimelia terevasa TaxID=53372 RepID=UPI00166F18F8|nr:MOSC N-terminal beta barrel domain-containing protein [Pilimelia terevasa]
MRLAEIYTYPIKGGYRRAQAEAVVEPWGLAGDRRWLVTDPGGRFLSQRQDPAMALVRPEADPEGLLLRAPGQPDLRVPVPRGAADSQVTVWQSTVAATPAGPDADAWLGGVLGRPVRLAYGDDPTRRPVKPAHSRPGDVVSFADSCPVTVANAASLDALNAWLTGAGQDPVPVTRFRPNLVVADAPAWAEDGWVGRRLAVGSAVFRAVKPAGRCLVVDTDQETGVRRGGVLRTLAGRRTRDREILFAVHLIPDGPGRVAVGDRVTVR